MIKADLVTKLSIKTGVERKVVSTIVETFMDTVRESLEKGENVYLREFGTFQVKKRLQKKPEILLKQKMDILLQPLLCQLMLHQTLNQQKNL